MSKKFCVYSAMLAILFAAGGIRADTAPVAKEYELKGVFIYRSANFVEWPPAHRPDPDLIIGIIGKDPFGNVFDIIKEKLANRAKIIIKRFPGLHELNTSAERDRPTVHPDADAIRKCHVLFVCPSEKNELKPILDMVKNHPILTVADVKGFLEAGGIMNLIMDGDKVRFGINLLAAQHAGVTVRSQLLRIASKVIEE